MHRRAAAVVPLHRWLCSSCRTRIRSFVNASRRDLHVDSPAIASPFRKQVKDETKRKRLASEHRPDAAIAAENEFHAAIPRWELTVGIEIHAQLNTERKLFTRALTSADQSPNTQVSLFDASVPGSQPQFQAATLLPALRAALALNCIVQRHSSFDRKHYFYPDQPAGYQITQYYAPLAKAGHIRLCQHDGIAVEDGDHITVGIKQIQMEQDTAKTIQQPPDAFLLDYNRVGYPLIEIITLPHIHHPRTAAACVKKIQQVLLSVSAVTTGMELGGLRADVNVSVRPWGSTDGLSSYEDVHGLGTRTEIKNLSSFKAIEDAVVAERNRQVMILESGGVIEGETRGWSLGSTETRKLRGKEGEIDYRYMPDPDLSPIFVSPALVERVRKSLPMLPDEQTSILTTRYGLSLADAKTLVFLDGGARLTYFQNVLDALEDQGIAPAAMQERAQLAGNWVLHELGALLTRNGSEFTASRVPVTSLATIIQALSAGEISGKNAKRLLAWVFEGDSDDVASIIEREDLRIQSLSNEEYSELAHAVIDEFPEMADKVRRGQQGKLQWLVGQMIRRSKGRLDAQRAAAVLSPLLQPPSE